MPSTNVKEIAFEELITNHLVGTNGFVQRFYNDDHKGAYDIRECIDVPMLFEFLEKSQPKEVEKLKENHGENYKAKFLEHRAKDEFLYIQDLKHKP